MQQNKKHGFGINMRPVFSGTLSPFSSVVSVVKIWDFSISVSAYSPPSFPSLCVQSLGFY